MSLLTPLFLFGLLGIALPIWLHRLQTQTTEREKFSSTMFLEASKQRIHVKRQLKYLLLMALRILFFIILAIAFTRPSLFLSPQATIAEGATHHVIVLDSSFSMHEGNRFAQGIAIAEDIINNMESGDQSSLFSASASVTSLAEASENKANLLNALNNLAPNESRLDIGEMISSLNGLIEASPANYVLHVISDFQQSGQATRFADMIPNVINGRPIRLSIEPVISDNTPNVAVDSIQVIDRNSVRVGLKNYSTAAIDQEKTLTLRINGIDEQHLLQDLSLPSEGIAFIDFNNLAFAEGDNKIEVQFSPSDSLAEDDIRYTVFDNSPPAPVLLLTANPDALAVTYITAALETAPRGYEVQLNNISDVDSRIFPRYPWLVIDDLGAIDQNLADALLAYINNGGSILAALGRNSQNLSTIPLSGQAITRTPNLNQSQSQSITQIDTSHPALDRATGWNNVNVSQSLSIISDELDSVLITTEDNSPFLLERAIGAGRLMLFSTSLNNDWSDFPVKPVFASFLAEAAQYLSNENLLIKEQVVDSYLQLSQTGGASGQVYDPDGESLLSLSGTTQSQDILLAQTGYYQVFTPAGEVLIAVNPDSRESDLSLTEVQSLQNWQNAVSGSLGSSNAEESTTAMIEEDGEEFELWRLFLLLLAIVVIAESLLGNRYLSFKAGA